MVLKRDSDLQRFRLVVEQLEVCRELIIGRTPAKARMALILLDNAAEIILYRLSLRVFSWDRFARWVLPERFSSVDRRSIDRVFQAKLDLAREEKWIDDADATILGICHSYRNAAFHRDTHNPPVTGVLARVGFKAVANLFVRSRGGIEASGAGGYRTMIDWLSAYGLADTFIDYEKAAKTITEHLVVDTDVSPNMIRDQLAFDISSRIGEIRSLVNDQLPWKSAPELNEVLKWFEFKDAEPELEDRLSQPYRSAVYKITSKHPVDITPEELRRIEDQFRAEYKKKVEIYEQQVRYEHLDRLEQEGLGLKEISEMSEVLARYAEMDRMLSQFEKYVELAAQEWDRAVQHEIDLRRGK